MNYPEAATNAYHGDNSVAITVERSDQAAHSFKLKI